jgi:hypothetical protein
MATDHRSEFKAQIEAALEVGKRQLARFRQLLDAIRDRLAREPNDYNLQIQVQQLEQLVENSEARLVLLQQTLDELTRQQGDQGSTDYS